MDTNSNDSVTNSSNPVQVGGPQPAAQAAREVASKPFFSTSEPAVQAEVEAASAPPPAAETGDPEHPSTPKLSRRVWRSGDPYYPAKPINRDEDHWKKVYEKVGQFDKEFCGGWNSEIDALLTFAGLFSAVVTAFTVESYKLLQPDAQDMTNRILMNVSAQLAGRNVTELPSGFTPAPSSIRINALWFLSLTFSLTAGLVGILCKQWLRHYQQDISKPPREALIMRQIRYDSFVQCRVMDILNALPVLLGLGLILFFVGLIDFLQGLDVKVSIPVTILIGIGFGFLVVTTSAPAFQYLDIIVRPFYSMPKRYYSIYQPLFAFKSPQSLAILHLVTWLFPIRDNLKVPNWVSLELNLFPSSKSLALRTCTRRALSWLDETYSHSSDMVHQIYLCLVDIDSSGGELIVEDMVVEDMGYTNLSSITPGAAIKSLFDTTVFLTVIQAESHVRRDIIAIRYLSSFRFDLSSDQAFIVLESLIRILNSSYHPVPSFQLFDIPLDQLSREAYDHPALAEKMQEISWQRGILFQNLLLEGRWGGSTGIPGEVQIVSKNLGIFTDEDLGSIFDAIRAWMDQHPQDADLPSHCWAALISLLKPYELRHRPPVRDFMAFLDSRFRIGDGIEYLCNELRYGEPEELDSFFKALYAWIKQNPQDAQSFIHCRTLLDTRLRPATRPQVFRDFDAFLEAQIARSENVVE